MINDDIVINWNEYVDKIYLITWTGNKNRNKLWDELKRVDIDINDHDLFLNFENISTPMYKESTNIFNVKIVNYIEYHYLVDVIFAQYYCMKHAQNYGYKKILILEDDVVFLKDKKYIKSILDLYDKCGDDNSMFVGNMLKFDGVNFDETGWSAKCLFYYDRSSINILLRKMNNNMTSLGSSAFNIYTKKAYEFHISEFENSHNLIQTDHYMYYKDYINIFYNDTNLCIQWKDMFIHINWFYLYNLDIYKDYINNIADKNAYLTYFKNMYKKEFINGQFVLMDNVKQYYIDMFNQINFLLFDNKLKITDILYDNTQY